ncbi:MAG: Ribose operon repressor [Lentisphaerae bacterium ADurb.Bin242]|nr:MAG: Ribose operon repressor [Lentisphaerae bacterium ADurb.Bin242]
MNVRLKDIAELANVDKSTVSHTLKADALSKRLKPETRERILRTAKELGYQRNINAVSIRTGQVNTIAVIGEFSSNKFYQYSPNLGGIIRECSNRNYGVKVFADDDLKRTFDEISGNRIKQIVSMSVNSSKRTETGYYARRLGLELVYTYEHPCNGFACINTDNFAGAEMVVSHLIELGHSRIALACAPHEYHYQVERHDGYLSGLKKAGLTPDPKLIFCSDDIEKNIGRLLSYPQKQRPTALFAIADSLALIAQRVAIKMGFTLPEDFSTFGFGNKEFCTYAISPLASIEESVSERCKLAVKMLLDKKSDIIPVKPGYFLVPPVLILRDSVTKPHNGTKNIKKGI